MADQRYNVIDKHGYIHVASIDKVMAHYIVKLWNREQYSGKWYAVETIVHPMNDRGR